VDRFVRATSRVASTCPETTSASVTGRTGGESISSRSQFSRRVARISFARSELSSSLGFGGTGPAVRKARNGSFSRLTTASASAQSPDSTDEKPRSFDSPKASCTIGRRRSQSSRITRCPAWANAAAKLVTTVFCPRPTWGW